AATGEGDRAGAVIGERQKLGRVLPLEVQVSRRGVEGKGDRHHLAGFEDLELRPVVLGRTSGPPQLAKTHGELLTRKGLRTSRTPRRLGGGGRDPPLTPPPLYALPPATGPAWPAGASPDTAFVLTAVIASRSVTRPSTRIASPLPVTVMTVGMQRSSR